MAELQHGQVPLQLRCAIVTCRLLFDCTFEEIERKTGVQTDTAAKIMRRAIFCAGNEDFQDVLTCVGDANWHGAPPRVSEGSQMSADVQNAMLKHNTKKPVDAIDKENLFAKVIVVRLLASLKVVLNSKTHGSQRRDFSQFDTLLCKVP